MRMQQRKYCHHSKKVYPSMTKVGNAGMKRKGRLDIAEISQEVVVRASDSWSEFLLRRHRSDGVLSRTDKF